MFIYLLFLLFCTYIYFELKSIRSKTIVTKSRYRLFALRDKLREHVMEERIKKNNWVFDYIDSTLTKTCDDLDWLNIWRALVVLLTDRNDIKFERARDHLENELKKSKNIFLREIHEEYADILLEYILEKHNFIFGCARLFFKIVRNIPIIFRSLIKPINQIKKIVKHGVKELTESPETSTLGTFSPIYKTA